MPPAELHRIRARLLGVLWAAAGVSVACNVLAAQPTWVGRGVAAWPPIALLLVVEVLARSPLPAGRWRWLAISGAGSVAGVAALASFTHMQAVATRVGESPLVASLFPLSVDGLAVVASVALVETNRRRPTAPDPEPASVVVPVDQAEVDPQPVARGDRPTVGAVFVPPVVGAKSPVLNGSGPSTINTTEQRTNP
jgi:hypothetical protein